MPSKKPLQKHAETTTDYWKHLLEDFPSSSKLWLDGFNIPERDSKKTSSYEIEKISFPPELVKALKKFSRSHKVTAGHLLYSAWGLLLHRFSGADDVIYGTTYFKANKKIDFYQPILPIRSKPHEEESLINYLTQTAENFATVDKHVLTSEKDQAIFKDVFSYLLVRAIPKKSKTPAHFKIKEEMFKADEFPLILVVKDEDKFSLEMWYNSARFTRQSITNIIEHFIVILQKILEDADELVFHFSILTKNEKKKLLHSWNKPTYKQVPATPNVCPHTLFMQEAKKAPNHPAIVYNETTVTYQQLDQLSNQIAQLILQKKIRPGDTVAVLMERTPLLLATMIAIFKAGAVYVPINPKYPDERIQFILDDCHTHLILVNNTEHIPQEFLYKTAVINEDGSSLKLLPHISPTVSVKPDSTAYIMYTSGTTGQPKGVMIRHDSLVNLVNWYKHYFSITSQDRASQFGSQGFDAFFCETIPFFALGASVHIIDDSSKLTPALFLPWLAKEKITVCDLTTAYAQILLNMDWTESHHLRVLKIGGESLPHYPTKKFSFDIWNCYGPTEATVETTFIKIYQAHTPPEKQAHKHFPPPIGKPIANGEVYVVDQHKELVGIGCVGELLLGGINVSSGYLNRPQLTREKFIRNIFSDDPEAKLYRTGDLVRWLEDGNLEFVGRLDHQVKIRGFRIELNEIETALNHHPDVNEVVVLAKELINGQKTLIAYLVPNLDKIRIPYQERALISLNEARYLQVMVEDISKEGIAITGITEPFKIGEDLQISFKLPGSNQAQWLKGKVIWQLEQRAGIYFETTSGQKELLEKSIEYYLSTHNLMETLQGAATKRSLRTALKKKLPDYMVPSVFTILPQFPLTFNGKIDWKSLPPPQDFERLLERNFVPPRTATEKEICAIWCDLLHQNQVSITDNFFDLGGNSLLVAQLSVKILQKFKISVPSKIFFDLPFIPVIAEYIDSKGKHYTFKSSIQDEINHDAILRDDILPLPEIPQIKKPQAVLLTGAAGFLGIYLLRELLKRTDAKIYCLIRQGSFESVASRFMSTADRFELSGEVPLANRRIILIGSDIGLDQFGIPTEQYKNLAKNVDFIYHCGAQVNTMASYTSIRNSNVQGTLEVIKFAVHTRNKPIHYVSTLSSAYRLDKEGNYLEDFPDADGSQLIGGYAISKWVSERLLTQIKNRGLPVAIYRSGYILGQSDSGITNMNDALLLLLKGCIQLGYAPNWKEIITILPVDFVSSAIIEISLHETKSSVFHLDHPKGMMWTDLIAWLNNYGYHIKLCSHQHWLKHLTGITIENALYPFLPHYLSQVEEPRYIGTGMAHAQAILKKVHLPYPEMSDQLLNIYMNYLCKVGFFPMPQNKRNPILT